MTIIRCNLAFISIAVLLCPAGLVSAQESLRPLEDLQRQVESQQQAIQQLQESLRDQQDVIQALQEREKIDSEAQLGIGEEELRRRIEQGDLPDDTIHFLENLSAFARRTVNGRIHIDHWGFPASSPGINIIENGDPKDPPESELQYRRLRFGVKGRVEPMNMSYRLEIEFSGQDGSQFRDAWIGWDDLVFFQTVRFGNQKRPYGWDHLNSSNFMVFLERPFVVQGFNEDSRRFGLASYGVSEDSSFNWQYGFFYLPIVQDAGSIVSNRLQGEFAGRVSNTWWYDEASNGRGYGHWGLSGTVAFPDGMAPNDGQQNNAAQFRTRPEARSSNRWLDTGQIAGAGRYEILGIESVLNWGAFQFAGEFMNLWLQREKSYGANLYLHGGYFYLSYFLTGEHIPWDRELGVIGRVKPFENFFHVNTTDGGTARGLGAWQVAVRLSYADFTSADIFGGIGENATFALNWYWNSHSRLQFNYIVGQVDERLAALSTGGAAIVSGGYQIVGVRCMIDF